MLCSISSPGPGLLEDEWVRCWSTIVVVPANVDLYTTRTSIISYNAEYASTQCLVFTHIYTHVSRPVSSHLERLMDRRQLFRAAHATHTLSSSVMVTPKRKKLARQDRGRIHTYKTLARGLLYLCCTTHAPGAGAAYRWC